MSDQSDDNSKNVKKGEKSPAVPKDKVPKDDKSSTWNPATEPPRKPTVEPVTKPGRGSSAIAWLALLLIVGLCVAAAWSVREAQRREGILDRRLAVLESTENSQRGELAKLEQQLQAGMKAGLAKVEAATAGQATQLESLEASLVIQRDEIARFGATDRKDWLLAEAEYLLRLANQRLIMAGDVIAATALMRSADNILLQLEDVTLHKARAAIAADLAALQAVPRVDVEGLYLRLAALIEQVERLAIFQLPDGDVAVEAVIAQDWQARLEQGYEQALHKLSDYIVIRRRDVPYEALMDPQWEGLVRQNLRMLLEQSQVALLSGNQLLFRESLQRANHWVGQFFEADEARSKALARDILALTDQTIAVEIPDVSRSLRELDEAMERRLQLEDGE